MGLDAFVQCNCYRQGKTKPFPFPELEHYYRQRKEGYWTFNLPEDLDSLDLWQKFGVWQKTACEHHGMRTASERISDWAGYRAFQEALYQIGWELLPTLIEELPNINWGFASPQTAVWMLKELQTFRRNVDLGINTFLIDTETGHTLSEYIESYNGVFHWGGRTGYNAGIDLEGFFIAERNHKDSEARGNVVFRSKRFEQRVIEHDENGKPRKVEYFDTDSETRFVTNLLAVSRFVVTEEKSESIPVRVMHVETRQPSEGKFEYILRPLEIVCRAAVETGNPVVWC
jgi:hypothetical protein